MEQIDERSFLILNALYLRKIADRDVLAECSGCSASDVDGILDGAAATGLVLGLGSQYVLTDEGRQAVLDYYEATYQDVRADPEIQSWYVRFETVNDRFLQLVSAWQTRGDGGDGQDRVYDRLARTVERHVSALDQVADRLPRYRHYADRFRRSLDRVDSGQVEYVTSPTVDSLHNIWFEFHEDILALLGRPRETVGG
ncbi:MAG: hypothetical protein QOD57_4735 [Actinomycetota bacterium]|jgi:hypothetical protein|nr:hypothetical protein [Actinomycetota bacterium]MDQ1501904.1 hypothetical protein [Actinomycetota bacterium]MDQ1507008.1 hypothetical protein [Actinomycetota bacterium]MDQ1566948.1 hypothetical protein [Actinomycetota bacterium]